MSSESREIMHDQHSHPDWPTYVVIGVVLTVITAAEVAIFYLEPAIGSRGLVIGLLMVLSTVKFVLVVMFYMHLKFDSRVFTGVFLFPLALGTLVILSLFMLYHILEIP